MSKALLHELGKSISFGRLSLPAKVLWPMLLAASDDQGRGMAEPDVIKWHVCPNVAEIEIGNVSGLLDEMAAQDMIALYQDDRDRAIYQIVRWWDFQQPSWAQPSKYSAPDGWLDRIRYQKKGAGLVTQNWADDGGWRCEQEPPSDGDQGNEGPGQEQSSDLPSTLPSDLPSQQGRGTIQDQYNSIQSDLAPGGAPPPEPPAPDEKPARTRKRKAGNGKNADPPVPTEHQAIFSTLLQAFGIDPNLLTKEQAGRFARLSKKIRDGTYTAADVEGARQFWYTGDWRGKRGSPPANDAQFLEALSRYRKQATQLQGRRLEPVECLPAAP